MSLEARISKLERQNRFFKIAAVGAILLMVGLAAAPNAQKFDSLVVSNKLVVGSLDNTRPIVVLQSEEGHAAISILDKNDKPRIALAFTESEGAQVLTFDKNEKSRIAMRVVDKKGGIDEGAAELSVNDEFEKPAARMAVRGSMRTILLKDGRGKERFGGTVSADKLRTFP